MGREHKPSPPACGPRQGTQVVLYTSRDRNLSIRTGLLVHQVEEVGKLVCSLGPTEVNDAVPKLCLVLEAANTDRTPRPWSVSRSVCVWGGGGLSGGAGVSARRGVVRDATASPDAGVWRSGVTTVRVEAGQRLGPRSEGRATWPT